MNSDEKLKYLVVGVGAVGGALSYFLTKADKDVTCVVRKEKVGKMRERGLTLIKPDGSRDTVFPKVTDEENIDFTPDVIFVCVKSYSKYEITRCLENCSDENTIIIPLLNVYTTGEFLQRELPKTEVTDGCVYIAAGKEDDCTVRQHGEIFRVVFGKRDGTINDRLRRVRVDLTESGIEAKYSYFIRRDAFAKFIYVSSQALCGLYYGVTAGEIQSNPEIKECFRTLLAECVKLGEAMGIEFETDEVQKDMDILDDLLPTSSTSLQRDIEADRRSEIEELIFDVVKDGKKLGVDMPVHFKLSEECKKYRYSGYQTDVVGKLKRFNCVCGCFGAGKTNFILNVAFRAAEKGKHVTIVDLDTVNPFYRSSNYSDELKSAGIKIISPCQFQSIESPALSAEIYSCFDSSDDDEVFLFDIGGNTTGARVLGMFADKIIEKGDYTCLYVANENRPQTDTVEKMKKSLREIEDASRVKVTGIVGNTHMLDETSVDMVIDSLPYTLSRDLSLELFCTCIPSEMLSDPKVRCMKPFVVKRFSRIL